MRKKKIIFLLVVVVVYFASFGCRTLTNAGHEIRCGIGYDYACGPAQINGPWVCGCIKK